jgi:hypothetical protein
MKNFKNFRFYLKFGTYILNYFTLQNFLKKNRI